MGKGIVDSSTIRFWLEPEMVRAPLIGASADDSLAYAVYDAVMHSDGPRLANQPFELHRDLGRLANSSLPATGYWNLTGGKYLYLGYLRAQALNKSDEYLAKLIELEPTWYSLFLSFLVQAGGKDTAKEIGKRFGMPIPVDYSSGRLCNEMWSEYQHRCQAHRPSEAVPFMCSSLFKLQPYGPIGWRAKIGSKYTLIVVVGDDYKPADIKEVEEYVERHQYHMSLTVVRYSDVKHLPQFQGVQNIPQWRMMAYGREFSRVDGLPTTGQVKSLYDGMQHKDASFSWTKTPLEEGSPITIFSRPYDRGASFEPNSVISIVAGWHGPHIWEKITRIVGSLEAFIVPRDPSYRTDPAFKNYFERRHPDSTKFLQAQYVNTVARSSFIHRPIAWASQIRDDFADSSVGLYDPFHHRIFVYADETYSGNPEILVHELMHALLFSLFTMGASSIPWLKKYYDFKLENNAKWPSNYSQKNVEEFFTECLTFYVMGGKLANKLKETDPFIYAVIDRFFKADTPSADLLWDVEELVEATRIKLPQAAHVGVKGRMDLSLQGGEGHFGVGVGFAHEIVPRLRLDIPAILDINTSSLDVRLSSGAELAYSIADLLLIFGSATVGMESPSSGGARFFYQFTGGFKVLVPGLWAELGVGATTNGRDVLPYLGLGVRF